jgi:hypothetical protein
VAGRNGSFLCAEEGVDFRANDPFLATFDTIPSPHRRFNAPRLLLAFVHIHGEAGTPTEGIWNAVVGRNGPFLCAEEGLHAGKKIYVNGIHMSKHSLLLTSVRLRKCLRDQIGQAPASAKAHVCAIITQESTPPFD